MTRLLCALLVGAALSACPSGEDLDVPEELRELPPHPDVTDTLLQIASYQQPCHREDGSIAICLLIRFEDDVQWTEYAGFIDGYVAQWGQRVSLDVTANGAEGWTLISEIVAVSKLGRTFAMTLQDDYLIGGARLVGGREFDCAEYELCARLDEQLAGGTRFEVWMKHPEEEAEVGEEDPLVLTAIPE
jgi:hypothetical protein